MSSADKGGDTTSISTSSSEDNVVERASGNLEQMKLEETAVQGENVEQVKSTGTPTGTSTALQAQDPIPGTSRDQHPGDVSREQGESGSTPRKDDCHAKESTASVSVEQPEEQPVPPPENEPEEQPMSETSNEGSGNVSYAHYPPMDVARFFMHGESLRSSRSSRSKSGNTSSDVSDIPTDVSDIPKDVARSSQETLYYEARERQNSEESCSEFHSALETQGSFDESTSASDLPLDSAQITISNLSFSTSISTDTGEQGNAAYRARCARDAEMLGGPQDSSLSGLASADQSELANRNVWFQRGQELVAGENRNDLPPVVVENSEEEDLGQRDAVLALEQWMQGGARVLAENRIEENLDDERGASVGSGSRIVPPEIPPRRFIAGACVSGEGSSSRNVPPEIPARKFISGEHGSSTAGDECRQERSLKFGNLLKKSEDDDNCSLSRHSSSDSIEPAGASIEDVSRSRSVKREHVDQAGPSQSKKKHWQKSGKLRSLQKPLAASMISIEEEMDSSKPAAKAIGEDSNPHPADDGLKESSGMECLVDSERVKSDQSAGLPMEVETRDIYAPSTSKQGLEISTHSKASTKRGNKSREFTKESAETKSSLPSTAKSKQESSSSKYSLQRKSKTPISEGKNPDERSTRKDADDNSEKEHEEKDDVQE
ncbi:hypothetical protein CDAR_410171 [Caerostris darwini]|uniref:Uncharacterized protein n=1 Tax=Caerostris darwini TaxID=1538125 RepID=A0AAV4VVV1_9ARAC|nr:hypothetical protein CDAR_410171 [Caerostris darwini]